MANQNSLKEDLVCWKNYIIKKGDTLSEIAQKYNIDWQIIYEQNKEIIGDNPDLIIPGQILTIYKGERE